MSSRSRASSSKKPASQLARLRAIADEFGAGLGAEKASLVEGLDRAAMPTARAVSELHEVLCFLRAYPDDAALLARVEAALERFERRADLRRFRAEKCVIGVEEHMEVRRFNVGLIPVIDWIEYDLGRELPEAAREHPAMSILIEAACRAVAFGNELYGYTKDRRARFINSVSCAEREDKSSTSQAFARIADLHDQAVAEMDLAGRALLAIDSGAPDPGARPLLAAWLTRLHLIVAGFAQWHGRAPRYATTHLDESDGAEVVLRLVGME